MAQRYPNLRAGVRTAALLPLVLLLTVSCSGVEPTTTASSDQTTTSRPVPPSSISPSTPTIDPHAGQPLIDHVEWVDTIDGPRLLVFPTRAGRQTTFADADDRAWREILAHSPEADSPGMRDQFRCHWVWARLVQPDKPSWNLEPWRPAVGYPATVDAQCNPGGPER
ncbi:DUF2599 domain-containing protein [Nocardia sp. CNY236]|uniref:DUF2599 domain-containing protein n=1 Tax=Nocardia sp. CNY236 TaxID=1169152 RepID=UPI0004908062|nr:DUF2599 domain-containing protein [Nocardia sp. CNY236]